MVSSDEAVDRSSVMGITKRVAELVLQGTASAGGRVVWPDLHRQVENC